VYDGVDWRLGGVESAIEVVVDRDRHRLFEGVGLRNFRIDGRLLHTLDGGGVGRSIVGGFEWLVLEWGTHVWIVTPSPPR
jgi:hypothetical protein